MESATTIAESPPGPSLREVSVEGRDFEPVEIERDPRLGADENREAQLLQLGFELARCEVGKQHGRPAVDVLREKCLVEMIGVEMRDIEVVGAFDARP